MKRLVFDARCMGTGVGTLTTNLLAGLRQLKPDFSTAVITSPEYQARLQPFCDQTIALDVPIYSAREQFQVPRAARGADLLHAMHYNAPLAFTGPLVVSIHDLTHLLDRSHARTWKSWAYARPMMNLIARKADHIFTLSAYSRDQIVRHLGVSETKVSITYVGVSDVFRPRESDELAARLQSKLQMVRPYLLYVGNLKPHKNVPLLLQAFADLIGQDADCDLVIVGDDRAGLPQVLAQIEKLAIQARIHLLRSLDLDDLTTLYAGAQIVVLPSLEEGFGLPVLEAMASGTPVACSRAASLPEVGGEAVDYFDPRSRDELASSLLRILQSPDRQRRMRDAGLARARLFTWPDCVRKHYEIYRNYLCN